MANIAIMEPSNSLPASDSTLTPSAEAGVDRLWKFQLRKENAALLEKLTTNEELTRNFMAVHHRKTEEALQRIAALEGKLLKEAMEAEKKTQDLRESRARELQGLKSRMKDLEETANANARLLAQLKWEPVVVNSTASNAKGPAGAQAEVATTSTSTSVVDETNIELSAVYQAPEQAVIKPQRPISRSSLDLQPPDYDPPTTRSQRRPTENATPVKLSVQAKQVTNATFELRQRDGPFQTYLDNANRLYDSLSKAERHSDRAFVARFIKGMRDSRAREKLSTKLQLAHPSRTKKDLTVEIICDWEDVLEAVKGMARGSGGNNAKERQARPKKRNILVPRDLVDDGA